MTQNGFVDLTAIADRFCTDKGSTNGDRHHYTELYAAVFESFRLRQFNLLELGLLRATDSIQEADPANRIVTNIPSIDMWLEYFPKATCYGFDLADFSRFAHLRFKFIRGDLSEDADILRLAQSVPEPLVIIDDASHASFHQQRAFARLFPILKPGGFYAIEDLHYSPPFESKLPACRPMWQIVDEFLETGALKLDFGSQEESKNIESQIAHSFVHCSSRGRRAWGPKLVIFQKLRNASILNPPEPSAPSKKLPTINSEWLSSRLFSFVSSHSKRELSSTLRFEPNGLISGYHHANEAAWKLVNGQLVILRQDGVPGCIASPFANEQGTVSFMGKFLFASGGIVHRFDENVVGDGPATVFSFDLFDTLVARRCYDAISIFKTVEHKSGMANFAAVRQREEHALWQTGDYTMGDIYSAVGLATGWSSAVLERLRMLELSEEWENLFPIEETVARVRPGDLIVSDMYLPLSFLRRIVEEKCGLESCVIHLSTHGKHRGEIWSRIKSTHRIMRHYGDNLHSDINGARRANLNAEHITVSRWNRGEQILIDAGLEDFAKIIREARLGSFCADIGVRKGQLAQFEVNLPLLVVTGLYVLQQAMEQDIDTLLMCSRDCNLWFPLMQWLSARSPAAPRVRYLVASRVLLLSHSPEYQAYFCGTRGPRNMLIDVSGTGRSPAYFLGSLADHAYTRIFLVAGSDEVGGFINDFAPTIDFEVFSTQPHERRLGIECLNTCLESRAHQMLFTGHGFDTLNEPNEFGQAAQNIITGMRAAFLAALTLFTRSDLRKAPGTISPETLRSAAGLLIGLIGDYRASLLPVVRDVNREEFNVSQTALAQRQRNLMRTQG